MMSKQEGRDVSALAIVFNACLFFFISFSLPAQEAGQLPSLLLDSAGLAAKPVYHSVAEAARHPDEVYKLNLNKQQLKIFPPEIFQFINLHELSIRKNKIKVIPGQIAHLQHLEKLDVSGNALHEIPPEIGQLTQLKKLVLSRNDISALPAEIGNLRQLEVLDIWDNNISFFPDELKNLSRLQWMDLRGILISDQEQEHIQSLLPSAKIFFSPGCNCKY